MSDKSQTPAEEPVTVNLGNINEGVALDAFALELRKVMENIADLSTAATATRSITLRFDFKPESDRCKVHTEFAATTKLAGVEKHVSKIVLPPDGIPLVPWRTFRDATPVESKFLLRLKQVKDDLPTIALYEIDQKWKLDTVNSIAKWLGDKITAIPVIA